MLVATKGGHLRPGDGSWTQDGRPEYLKEAVKASARRLGVDAIGLYQFHRPDPRVPYADSVGAIRDLLDEGVIQMAGISNANVAQIDEANAILGGRLVSVQNQFSPAFRSSLAELEHCAALGIAFLPVVAARRHPSSRRHGPASTRAFQRVADARGVSPQQVALAWELALAPVVIPIPGASRPESIRGLRAGRRPRAHRRRAGGPRRALAGRLTHPEHQEHHEDLHPPRHRDRRAERRARPHAHRTRRPTTQVRELVRTARDAGIDFLDHADVYGDELHGCERRFAEAMQLTPSERDEFTIQTKAGIVRDGPYFDFSYEHIVESVERLARRRSTPTTSTSCCCTAPTRSSSPRRSRARSTSSRPPARCARSASRTTRRARSTC